MLCCRGEKIDVSFLYLIIWKKYGIVNDYSRRVDGRSLCVQLADTVTTEYFGDREIIDMVGENAELIDRAANWEF